MLWMSGPAVVGQERFLTFELKLYKASSDLPTISKCDQKMNRTPALDSGTISDKPGVIVLRSDLRNTWIPFQTLLLMSQNRKPPWSKLLRPMNELSLRVNINSIEVLNCNIQNDNECKIEGSSSQLYNNLQIMLTQ